MKVLIVDDHVLFREGVVSLLNSQPDITVIGEAGGVDEAIAMARELEPELILMDFGLPDGTGLDATQAILAERADVIMDFTNIPVGTEITLLNLGPDEPFGGGIPGEDFDPMVTGAYR